MKRSISTLVLGLLLSSVAFAGRYEWTAGWAMGVSEYAVDDGNANELVIACPDSSEQGAISATATINGRVYYSAENGGFDVLVDGERFTDPFNTECRVCADIFSGFWPSLRAANRLQLSADGVVVNLPIKNIHNVLPALEDAQNTCRVAW